MDSARGMVKEWAKDDPKTPKRRATDPKFPPICMVVIPAHKTKVVENGVEKEVEAQVFQCLMSNVQF